MPRKCESGVMHNTFGEIRGCSTCQRNGAASGVHAKHGNDELVDPAPAAAAPSVETLKAAQTVLDKQPVPRRAKPAAKKPSAKKPAAKPKAKRRR